VKNEALRCGTEMSSTTSSTTQEAQPASETSPPRKRLLILGANRYNVPGIRAARQAGFVTLVADRNPQAPGLAEADVPLTTDITDPESLRRDVDRVGGIDGVVSMAEVGVRPAAWLATRLGLPSIGEDAAARATSKSEMRRSWAELGRFSPQYFVAQTEAEAVVGVEKLKSFPLLFKPDRSHGGSRGVSRANDLKDVSAAFAFAQGGGLPGSAVVIEQLVTGTEHSAEVLIWKDQTSVLCIGQKIKSPLPYRVDVSVQYPARLTPTQEADAATMCDQAVRALGLTQGAAHVEFAWTADGPVLFELGARCGGGHTPQIARHVSGVDEFIEVCRMACGVPPDHFRPIARRAADYRFLVFPPGRVAHVDVPNSFCSHEKILDASITLHPGDEIHSLRSTADRAGFVVTLGENLDSAAALADWACQQCTVTYIDGRVAHARVARHFLDR
jgi:biotin carboxylase